MGEWHGPAGVLEAVQAASPALDLTFDGLISLLDKLPVAVAVTRGADHRFVYANELYRKIHEPLHGPLLGRTVAEVFEGVLDQAYMYRRDEVLRNRTPHTSHDVPIPLTDRVTYWDITLIPVATEDDTEGILTIAVEMTDRVEARAASQRYMAALEESSAAVSYEKDRLAVAVEATGIGIWEWDVASGRIYWSDRMREIFGWPAGQEITYEDWRGSIHPDDKERVLQTVQGLLAPESDGVLQIRHRMVRPDGNTRWIASSARMLYDDEGRERVPQRLLGTVLDVTDREAADERLRDALGAKDMLLREAHHRVKNSLHIVSAMLSLQERTLDERGRMALQDASTRIRTIASLHEQLYRARSTDRIELAAYLSGLCNNLAASGARGGLSIEFAGPELWVPTDRAVAVALITNELVTNALKYAYPDGVGVISVSLRAAGDGSHHLLIEDQGVGLGPDFDSSGKNSLGWTMARSLARGIGSELKILPRECGACFCLTLAGPDDFEPPTA